MTTKLLNQLKKKCLVFDIETSAFYPDGEEIDIRSNFDDYVRYAKCKWFGAYSYKHDIRYLLQVTDENKEDIRKLISQHSILIGFNSEEFDTPILYNNDLIPEDIQFLQVDCLTILGSSVFQRHDGLSFKNRGALMGYKFKRNSLKVMAETMKLETQKGDIDWKIFQQDDWNDEEKEEIEKYLRGDVMATKQIFDKLWAFWLPFTEFISEVNIQKLSWIKSSIASLTYQAACYTMNVEETYGEPLDRPPEKMGGNVIEPKYEEAKKVWYVDFASLYPHINVMFNIPAEITEDDSEVKTLFHHNKLFETRGHYDISQQHPLALDIKKKLKARMKLKKEDPDNPLIYTYKIFLNSLYGAQRSPIFEQVYSPNAGWDICWLGQQIQKYTEKRMKDFGFETIAGDTDSIFVVLNKDCTIKNDTEKNYVQGCLNKIVEEINKNVPFPCNTFKIDIEQYIDYIMWPFSEQPVKGVDGKNLKNEKNRLIKKRKGKKKNYVYIYNNDTIKIVGLPIIKDNATKLGQEMLIPLKKIFLELGSAKISKKTMKQMLRNKLLEPDNIKLLAREFKVKPAESYKKESQIQAQISIGYFNGQAGVIELIKNKIVGNAGKTAKYCTIEEAFDYDLDIKDLDLTKIKNELEPFTK